MAEKKRSIMDYGIQIVRELIVGRLSGEQDDAATTKEIKLKDLKQDDLLKEKIRLEKEERNYKLKFDDLESRKNNLDSQGRRSVSEREMIILARNVKELDLEMSNIDKMMQVISKQKRIINGLIMVKENERLLSQSGVTSLLNNIDMQDLIKYVDQASVDGEFHLEKFDQLLITLEQNEATSPQISEDPEVLDIVAQWQRGRESLDNPEAIKGRLPEMDARTDERNMTDLESPEEEF